MKENDMEMIYDDAEIKDIIAEFATKAYGIPEKSIRTVNINHTSGNAGNYMYRVTVSVKTKDARPEADTYRTLKEK